MRRLLVVLATCAFVLPASAHDWYPTECCNLMDCGRMGTQSADIEPEPKAVEGGWLLWDGTLVPYDQTRQTPDRADGFHSCREGRERNKPLITKNGKACLWVPKQGT